MVDVLKGNHLVGVGKTAMMFEAMPNPLALKQLRFPERLTFEQALQIYSNAYGVEYDAKWVEQGREFQQFQAAAHLLRKTGAYAKHPVGMGNANLRFEKWEKGAEGQGCRIEGLWGWKILDPSPPILIF